VALLRASPDMKIPEGLHLNPNRIPVPPQLEGYPHELEIARHYALMTSEQRVRLRNTFNL
jgi:hypothetical protein